MSFALKLLSDLVIVEPGTTMPLGLEIENREETSDRFEIFIEGLDNEWTAIPVPILNLGSKESQTVKVFFKPPRESDSTAGNYPFVIRVRSLVNGDDRTAQGVLQVKPYNHLSFEITPKKGFVSPGKKINTFFVTAMNLGNAEHTIQFSANDPEDACTYEFELDELPLGAGQQKEIEVTVNPVKRSVFGSSRLIGFAIVGRSLETPSVVGNTQAQLEVRPLFTGTTIAFLAFVVLLITLLIATAPKPPTLSEFKVNDSRPKATRGDKILVAWKAEDSLVVRLRVGDKVVADNLPVEGTKEVNADPVGVVSVGVSAGRDGKWSEEKLFRVTVEEPKFVPDPKIELLEPSSKTVAKGQRFILRYKFNAAVVMAKLAPKNVELDLKLDTVEVDPTLMGPNEYTVIAENSAGKSVKTTFKIMVTDPSLADIVKFDVQPDRVPAPDPNTVTQPATVTISWQVTNAQRIELLYPGSRPVQLIEPMGEMQLPVSVKTTFTLKVYDSKGKTTSQSKTITITPAANPPTVDSGQPVPPATTAGGTGLRTNG